MNKHVYAAFDTPLPDLVPEWKLYRCIHCKKKAGLTAWELKELPVGMAKCEKSPVHIGLWERIRDSVNCLGRWKWMILCRSCGQYIGSVTLPIKPGRRPKQMVIWKTCRKCEPNGEKKIELGSTKDSGKPKEVCNGNEERP